MPNYFYCKDCKTHSIVYDPETKTATCESCGVKVVPQVRQFEVVL